MGRRVGFDDGWDAPPMIKAQMAFDIIWLLVTIFQSALILKAIRLLPPVAKGRSYCLLLKVTLILFLLNYLLDIVRLRTQNDATLDGFLALSSLSSILYSLSQVLLPITALHLLHLRARSVVNTSQQDGMPWPGQTWKRCFDWACVVVYLIFLIAETGIFVSIYKETMIYARVEYLAETYDLFVLFRILVYFLLVDNVTGSSIALKSAFKKRNGAIDPITNTIVRWMIPALTCIAFEVLLITIIIRRDKERILDYLALGLAQTIIIGLFSALAIWGLYKTLLFPETWSTPTIPATSSGINASIPMNGPFYNATWTQPPLTHPPQSFRQQPGWVGQPGAAQQPPGFYPQPLVYQPPPGPPQQP